MAPGDLVLVRCELARGGFSSERVFRVKTLAGGTLAGVADLEYCFTAEKERLGADDPPAGKTVRGFVAARVIRPENGSFLISVPDGSVASVQGNTLVQRSGGGVPD
jgi:hypothetical protein